MSKTSNLAPRLDTERLMSYPKKPLPSTGKRLMGCLVGVGLIASGGGLGSRSLDPEISLYEVVTGRTNVVSVTKGVSFFVFKPFDGRINLISFSFTTIL